jgi:hypothetical protein
MVTTLAVSLKRRVGLQRTFVLVCMLLLFMTRGISVSIMTRLQSEPLQETFEFRHSFTGFISDASVVILARVPVRNYLRLRIILPFYLISRRLFYFASYLH